MPSPRKKKGIVLKRLPSNPYIVGAWIGFLVVGLVLLAIEATTHAIMGGPKYLYHHEGEEANDSPVIELLDNANLDFLEQPSRNVDYVPPPRVVEFYAPWCPHCQHYAPRYKVLATNLKASHPNIQFYAVSCVAHNAICKSQNVHSYPTLKIFKEGSYEEHKGGVKDDAEAVLKVLGISEKGTAARGSNNGSSVRSSTATKTKLRKAKQSSSSSSLVTTTQEEQEKARIIPFRDHDVHDAWADASTSFEFALQNSIYMTNGPLEPMKQKALKEWLELLEKSLPSQMNRTRTLVEGLLQHFAQATGGQDQLDLVVKQFLPSKSKPKWAWRTCTYGDNSMGYTCGLWQLFHVMSVGVVEYNIHMQNGNNDVGEVIATRHASETLRNYIDHFFQCDVCRMNFLSMYDTCAFDGCHRLSENPSLSEEEWRELPLWLWETHNDVNVRLLGERHEQNQQSEPNQWESQQARWPALYACPNCWREDHSWEEEKVFKHLRAMYWTGNISYLKIPSGHDGVEIGGETNGSPLRWKLTLIVFGVALMVLRLYRAKKVMRNSGRHKK